MYTCITGSLAAKQARGGIAWLSAADVAYQKILAVFATAAGGMRAKDVCLALDLSVTAKDTEGMRAKLKRLVARQILVEAEPGLFMLASTPTA